MFAEDLDQFYRVEDFAVAASWTPANGDPAQIASVILDAPGELILGEAVISADYTIRYPAAKLAGLDVGEIVRVAGIDYQVRAVMPQPGGDGAETLATLAKI